MRQGLCRAKCAPALTRGCVHMRICRTSYGLLPPFAEKWSADACAFSGHVFLFSIRLSQAMTNTSAVTPACLVAVQQELAATLGLPEHVHERDNSEFDRMFLGMAGAHSDIVTLAEFYRFLVTSGFATNTARVVGDSDMTRGAASGLQQGSTAASPAVLESDVAAVDAALRRRIAVCVGREGEGWGSNTAGWRHGMSGDICVANSLHDNRTSNRAPMDANVRRFAGLQRGELAIHF